MAHDFEKVLIAEVQAGKRVSVRADGDAAVMLTVEDCFKFTVSGKPRAALNWDVELTAKEAVSLAQALMEFGGPMMEADK